jgi:membrane protein YdbS with pleckstrin-like domain
MNKFYTLSPILQWTIALLMIMVMVFLMGYWVELMDQYSWSFVLIFLFVPFLQFLLTPYNQLSGFIVDVLPGKREVELS